MKGNDHADMLMPVESDHETLENKSLRDQKKAERLAQLRDDPYYIIDDPPAKVTEENLIPVVHLEDMPPIPHVERLPSLRTPLQTFSSESFVIDKDGEMPEGAVVRLSQPATSSDRSATPTHLTSLPVSDYSGILPRSQTPDPITVVRTKKKGPRGKKWTASNPAS